jgi:hypothetical protein
VDRRARAERSIKLSAGGISSFPAALGCMRRRWRREWDSNPRYGFPYTRFPSERLQPLGHPSKGKQGAIYRRGFELQPARYIRHPPRTQAYTPRNFDPAAPLFSRLKRGDTGDSHGTRTIAMAHRHSVADHSSDLGLWRPARLILLGDAVYLGGPAPAGPLHLVRFRRRGTSPTLAGWIRPTTIISFAPTRTIHG